jgi:hypothetical protein
MRQVRLIVLGLLLVVVGCKTSRPLPDDPWNPPPAAQKPDDYSYLGGVLSALIQFGGSVLNGVCR